MNKKILISLATIGAVAAIAVGGTIAFFSDTETSTGNTFTAGAIDLTIDNKSYVTNPETGELMVSTSTSWEFNDLDQQLFFNFVDLKPGDVGEDTISLHVESNDAWACMSIALTGTPENEQTEPEAAVDTTAGTNEGELQDELYFVFWADDGDNVYEEGEVIFAEGLAAGLFDGVNWALADSQTNVWGNNPGTPLTGEIDYYIGKVWCYGDLEKNPAVEGSDDPIRRGTTGFTCNGEPVTNVSQTDGITADVTFYAEQSRNNPNFTCVQPIHVTSGPLYYGPTGWGGWSCPVNTTVVDGSIVVSGGDLAQTFAWKPGATTGPVGYPNTPFGYIYGVGETGYIGQNDNDSGETIYLDFDCMPN